MTNNILIKKSANKHREDTTVQMYHDLALHFIR